MIILRDFKIYIPTSEDKLELYNRGVTFIENEVGDWYDVRYTLTEGKTKVLLDVETKCVVAQTNSINGLWPMGFILVEIDDESAGDLIGLAFDEKTKTFKEYVPSDDEVLETAERKLVSLRKSAQSELESLKLAEEIDKLDKDEKARMKVIKAYLVDLMRVPKQDGYPRNINWPTL